MTIINKKAPFQKQLLDMSNAIEELQEGIVNTYTIEEADELFQTKEAMSSYYTKTQANNTFLAQAALTDYSINEIIVGNSQIDSDTVDLKAVYSQDVKSEISAEPTSTIIRTMSGTDVSTIGISATEIDVTTPMLKYNSNEVLSVDSNNNLNKSLVRVTDINSIEVTNAHNKGKIQLTTGIYFGKVKLESEGIESNGSVVVKGTSTPGAEGVIELNGTTTVYSENRIQVNDGNTTKQVAYLSDITGAAASTYTLALGTDNAKFWFATISAEPGLEGTYDGNNFWGFITKYARYVNWYYEKSDDTTNNHKSFIIKTPGQTLLFYGMDGSDFTTQLPSPYTYLTVTKMN